MTLHHRSGRWLNSMALVAGTTVGAGILALPAVTFSAGVLPSSVMLIGIWLYLGMGALLLVEVNLDLMQRSGRTKVGLLAMVEETLGQGWGWLACGAYLFMHYALLVAYVSEGGRILLHLLHQGTASWLAIVLGKAPVVLTLPGVTGPLLFVVVFGGIPYWGRERLTAQVNNSLVAIALVAFGGLLLLQLPQLQPSHLLTQSWHQVSPAIPVMLVALFYHNVVPVVTTQLEGDRPRIRSAILVGSAIPLVMFLAWNGVILGALDPALAQEAASGSQIFDPLDLLRQGTAGVVVGVLVSIFSELAIATSFIGFIYGLTHFFSDALNLTETQEGDRLTLFALIILPPLLLSLFKPDLFFAALDAAGTLGIALLAGILPALMIWQQHHQIARDRPTATDGSSQATNFAVLGGPTVWVMMVGVACVLMVDHVWRMNG